MKTGPSCQKFLHKYTRDLMTRDCWDSPLHNTVVAWCYIISHRLEEDISIPAERKNLLNDLSLLIKEQSSNICFMLSCLSAISNNLIRHLPITLTSQVSLRDGRVQACLGLFTSFCQFSRHQTHLWLAAALQTSMMAFFQIFWACIASWSSLHTELRKKKVRHPS